VQYQGTPEAGEWLAITPRYVEHLKGTYTGLLRFCEGERLDGREVLAWWPLVLAHMAIYQGIFDSDHFPVDEEEAAAMHRLLRTWWES